MHFSKGNGKTVLDFEMKRALSPPEKKEIELVVSGKPPLCE